MYATQSSLRAISTPSKSLNENQSSHIQSRNDLNLQLTIHQWRIQRIEAVSLLFHRPIAMPLAGASCHFQLISCLIHTASCQTDTQFHPEARQNFWKRQKFWILFWETFFTFASLSTSSHPWPFLFFHRLHLQLRITASPLIAANFSLKTAQTTI